MAYIKQDFQGGDVLYADQLNLMDNKIEENDTSLSRIIQQINDLQARVTMVEKAALTTTARTALINFLANVAYTHNAGKQYYDQLTDSLTIGLVSISAVFMNNVLIYDTDTLDILRQYLTVAATYEDGVTQNITNYSLSGLLQPGTRTITVIYNNFTTTFDITVVHNNIFLTTQFTPQETIYTDTVLEDLKPYLIVTRHSSTDPDTVISALDYTLSGELIEGTSTVIVKYQNLATTFEVTVVKQTRFITASYTDSGDIYAYEDINILKNYLTITYYENSEAQGIVIPATDYSLVGSLEIGINTITAIYNKRRTTFSIVAKNPAHITATFNPGAFIVYEDTALDQLKDYLVVLYYENLTAAPIQLNPTKYTLSGNLTAGVSEITILYGDLVTTYNVVTKPVSQKEFIANFDFTESLTDKTGNITPVINALEGYDAPQRTNAGLIFSQPTQAIYFGEIDPIGKTFEYDVASFQFAGNPGYHVRLLMFTNGTSTGTSPFIYRAGQGYNSYGFSSNSGMSRGWSPSPWPGMQGTTSDVINMISGKTVRLVFESNNSVALYLDNTFIGRQTDRYYNSNDSTPTGRYCKNICFGADGPLDSRNWAAGDQCHNLTLSGFRIYSNITRDPERHIIADFNPGTHTIYQNTSIANIKKYLTVTYYANNEAEGVVLNESQYSISGTLQEGTSTLTVLYEDVTTTFELSVESATDVQYIMNFNFKESLEDSVNGITPTLDAASGTSAPIRTNDGIVFNASTQCIVFGDLDPVGKTFEFDISSFSFAGSLDYHVRLLMFSNGRWGISPLMYRANTGYNGYGFSESSGTTRLWSNTPWAGLQGEGKNVIDLLNDKTVKIVFETQNQVALYINNELIGYQTDRYYNSASSSDSNVSGIRYCKRISFGGESETGYRQQRRGDQCYNLILSGFRVYENGG